MTWVISDLPQHFWNRIFFFYVYLCHSRMYRFDVWGNLYRGEIMTQNSCFNSLFCKKICLSFSIEIWFNWPEKILQCLLFNIYSAKVSLKTYTKFNIKLDHAALRNTKVISLVESPIGFLFIILFQTDFENNQSA